MKEARDRLRGAGPRAGDGAARSGRRRRVVTRAPRCGFDGVWHEIADGPAILRGIDLELRPGELVALMGRNGAGKSTLLRHAKGLVEPTRGRIVRDGDVALLLQNPGDFLIHEHVGDEAGAGCDRARRASPAARPSIRATCRAASASGSRSRSCWRPTSVAVVCLDEPTRGMDRGWKEALGRAAARRSRRAGSRWSSPRTTPSSRRAGPSGSC